MSQYSSLKSPEDEDLDRLYSHPRHVVCTKVFCVAAKAKI